MRAYSLDRKELRSSFEIYSAPTPWLELPRKCNIHSCMP